MKGSMHQVGKEATPANVPPRKPSASAQASLDAELARIQRMTAKERMALALALGRRRQELAALRAGKAPGSGR